jgi:hypothetical protein
METIRRVPLVIGGMGAGGGDLSQARRARLHRSHHLLSDKQQGGTVVARDARASLGRELQRSV